MVPEFEAIDWHKTSPEDVQKRLNVDSARGLSLRDAEERLKKHGMNKISPLPNPWFWKIKGISTAAFWWLIQPLSATLPQNAGRALSDREYPPLST